MVSYATPCPWACRPIWRQRLPKVPPSCGLAVPSLVSVKYRIQISFKRIILRKTAYVENRFHRWRQYGNRIDWRSGRSVDRWRQHSCVDINPDSLTSLQQQFGVTTALQIDVALATCEVIVLAVKPQQMRQVVDSLKPFIGAQLIVTIAAGIRSADLSR